MTETPVFFGAEISAEIKCTLGRIQWQTFIVDYADESETQLVGAIWNVNTIVQTCPATTISSAEEASGSDQDV